MADGAGETDNRGVKFAPGPSGTGSQLSVVRVGAEAAWASLRALPARLPLLLPSAFARAAAADAQDGLLGEHVVRTRAEVDWRLRVVELSDVDFRLRVFIVPSSSAAGFTWRIDTLSVRASAEADADSGACVVSWSSAYPADSPLSAAEARDATALLEAWLSELGGTLALNPQLADAAEPLADDIYLELRELVWPIAAPKRDLARAQSVWYKQGFTFSTVPGNGIGFVQPANGPCGVLAATLAEMLAEALFRASEPMTAEALASVDQPTACDLLARAMTSMLWRAAAGRDSAVPPSMQGVDGAGIAGGAGGSGSGEAERRVVVVLPASLDDVRVPEASSAADSSAEEVKGPDDEALAALRAAGVDVDEAMAAMRSEESLHGADAAGSAPPAGGAALRRAQSSFQDPFNGTAGEAPLMHTHTFATKDKVLSFLREHIAYFTDGPGCLLLLYSLSLTRTIPRMRDDMSDEVSVTSLIYENACSEQCVVNLMLTGVARYNIGDDTWPGWDGQLDVGFITTEDAYTVGQAFLCPRLPIWVVLGGGHYTTTWATDAAVALKDNLPPLGGSSAVDAAMAAAVAAAAGGEGGDARVPCTKPGCDFYGTASHHNMCSLHFRESGLPLKPLAAAPPPPPAAGGASASPDEIFYFYHFNGLHPPHSVPPGAPTRLARVRVAVYGDWRAPGVPASEGDGAAADAGDDADAREAVNQARRVQRVLERKDGLYHVVCAPDGSMEGMPRPAGRKWRCRDCHNRSEPVWSAFNEADSDVCRACGKHFAVCGFCHWLKEEELPAAKRDEYARANAPPMLKMLRAKFPRADADWLGAEPPALFG